MTEAPTPYGTPNRGVNLGDVSQAADALLRTGERPTVEKIRAAIGRGSPNTVGPLLDAWWKRLAGRLDSGPAAFHRLQDRDRTISELESRIRIVTGLLQKEQASRNAMERRLSEAEGELSAAGHGSPATPKQTSDARRGKSDLNVAHRTKLPAAKRKQTPMARKRKQTSRRS